MTIDEVVDKLLGAVDRGETTCLHAIQESKEFLLGLKVAVQVIEPAAVVIAEGITVIDQPVVEVPAAEGASNTDGQAVSEVAHDEQVEQ